MKKDIIYSLSCLAFAIVIGGAVYEHLSVVPQWSAAPPASLSIFQGPYRLKAEVFWMLIHPVCLALFTLTAVLHWKTARRKHILIAFFGYLVILAITFAFFVPELIAITSTAYSQIIDPELTARASLWETLSLVRLSLLITLSIIFFTGLTKSNCSNPRIISDTSNDNAGNLASTNQNQERITALS